MAALFQKRLTLRLWEIVVKIHIKYIGLIKKGTENSFSFLSKLCYVIPKPLTTLYQVSFVHLCTLFTGACSQRGRGPSSPGLVFLLECSLCGSGQPLFGHDISY